MYCTQQDGCATEGWYLFYTSNDTNDLVAFVFPCDDVGLPVSGKSPQNPLALCDSDKRLSLDNPNQFRYALPVSTMPAYPNGLIQFGSNGKEIIGGVTVDQGGNSYLFGITDGSLGNDAGTRDQLFVAKINPSGEPEWVSTLPAADGSLIFDATTDAEYLYACGITKFGDSDIYSSWAQCSRELRLYTEIFLGHPAKNRQVYLNGAPILQVENVQKPVLVMHGLLDDIVPPEASEEWVAALKRHDKTYEYKTYAGEPHGFQKNATILDAYTRLERFLDWYLLPPAIPPLPLGEPPEMKDNQED